MFDSNMLESLEEMRKEVQQHVALLHHVLSTTFDEMSKAQDELQLCLDAEVDINSLITFNQQLKELQNEF